MAEPRDEQPTGRMLFTDFDASDKGRPTVDLGQMQAAPRHSPRHREAFATLDDLASSLDFGFEDDDGESAPPPPARWTAAKRAAAPAYFDDVMQEADGRPMEPGEQRHARNAAPTWDEYANSFLKASPAPREDDLPTRHTEVDIRPIAADIPREAPADYDESKTETDADEDIDILSSLPLSDEEDSGEQAHQPFEGDWRGQRLGVEPPRERPYGGITRLEEWYRPPEAAEEETVETASDWYEPPENEPQPSHSEGVTEQYTEARNPEPPEPAATASTTVVGKRGSDTTQQLDLFRGVDLDSLWEETIQAKQNVADSGRTSTSTRDFGLFEDLDLEAAWEQKQTQTPDRKAPESAAAPEETLILDQGAYDNASTLILAPEELNRHMDGKAPDNAATLILSQDELNRQAQDEPPPKKRKPTSTGQAEARPKAKSPPTATPDGEEEQPDFLQGLDKLFGDMPEDDPLKAGKHPLPRKRPPEDAESPHRDESDTFDLDQLIAMTDTDDPAVNDDVAAPVVGDADIADLRRRKKQPDATETVELTAMKGRTGEADPDQDDAYIPSDLLPADAPDATAPGENEDEAPAGEPEEAVAVNPMDVFANMDDMDFSDDGLDDEMKAMLDEDAAEAEADAGQEANGETSAPPIEEKPPEGIKGKLLFFGEKILGKVVPRKFLHRVNEMIAWKENWWFYCDLAAAIIASASLAIIISYYVWYNR